MSPSLQLLWPHLLFLEIIKKANSTQTAHTHTHTHTHTHSLTTPPPPAPQGRVANLGEHGLVPGPPGTWPGL